MLATHSWQSRVRRCHFFWKILGYSEAHVVRDMFFHLLPERLIRTDLFMILFGPCHGKAQIFALPESARPFMFWILPRFCLFLRCLIFSTWHLWDDDSVVFFGFMVFFIFFLFSFTIITFNLLPCHDYIPFGLTYIHKHTTSSSFASGSTLSVRFDTYVSINSFWLMSSLYCNSGRQYLWLTLLWLGLLFGLFRPIFLSINITFAPFTSPI